MQRLILKLSGASVGRHVRSIPHSGNARLHWRTRAAWNKAWKDQASILANCARSESVFVEGQHHRRWEVGGKHVVTITLHAIRGLDADNAHAAIKPIVDGLKGVLVVDDSPEHIDLIVKQVKVRHLKDEHVEVTVCELEDPAATPLAKIKRPEQEQEHSLI